MPEAVIAERGVDRWLWQELAWQQQIAANLDVHLPAGFVWHTLRTLVPEAPQQLSYDRAALAWRLIALLDPAQLTAPAFAPVRGYLVDVMGTEADTRKRYQLGRRRDWVASLRRSRRRRPWAVLARGWSGTTPSVGGAAAH